jgi:hypothetical protein
MPMEFDLVAPATLVEANGEGPAVDVSPSQTRTFLCFMHITEVFEQQSIDVSIFGSPDTENWEKMPILKLPQRFYRGETRMVLDLTTRPEVRSIRARWELHRWGRVAPTPRFVFGLHLVEVPPMSRPTPQEAQDQVAAKG